MIESHAADDRQPVQRDRVGDEPIQVFGGRDRRVVAGDLHVQVRVGIPAGDQVARRPDLLRRHRRAAPRAAELHLVLAGEVVGVAADVILRPIALVLIERVVGDAAIVEIVVGAQPAFRREHEAAVDMRDLRGGEQPRAQDEVTLALEVLGRPGLVPGRFPPDASVRRCGRS